MSVALDWQGAGQSAPVRRPQHARAEARRRRHLTVVTDMAPQIRRPASLTRRGRLVRTLVLGSILLAVLLWRLAPLAAPVELTVDRAVSVRPGESLSEVAAEQLPGVSVDEGIQRIRLVNDLPGTAVYAGQQLLIPSER